MKIIDEQAIYRKYFPEGEADFTAAGILNALVEMRQKAQIEAVEEMVALAKTNYIYSLPEKAMKQLAEQVKK